MYRLPYFLAMAVFPALVAGCTLNSIKPLPTGSAVREGRAIVVYGVGVEGKWNYSGFKVELDEYSVQAQALTGDCLRFNRMEATVPPTQGPVQYFAFDVPPGAYVYSPFNGAPLQAAMQPDAQAFVAPEGRTVYAGDFVYSQNRAVVVHRDLDAVKQAVAKALPNLAGEISPAQAIAVRPAKPFLCTP